MISAKKILKKSDPKGLKKTISAKMVRKDTFLYNIMENYYVLSVLIC